MKRKPVALFLSAIVLTGCADSSPTETISTDSNSTPNSTSTFPISTTTSNTNGTTMPSDTTDIAATGSGGTIEEQIDNYIEATEEIKEAENNNSSNEESTPSTTTTKPVETNPVSTTPKYTVAEEPEEDDVPVQKVDTSTIKQGDYTAGGYLPTTVNPKYQNNGLNYWDSSQGTLFRENEIEDLYNWVSAGYTRWRTEDVRIASRKGGTDNPRIATYLSLDNNDNWAAAKDTQYCYVTVKMGTYKNGKVSDELREICESINNYTDENKESYKKAEKLAEAYLASHDMEDELNWYADEKGHPDEKNTTVNYNCIVYLKYYIMVTSIPPFSVSMTLVVS